MSDRTAQPGWRIGALGVLLTLAGGQLYGQLCSHRPPTVQDPVPAPARAPARVTPTPVREDAPPDAIGEVQVEGRLETASDGSLVPNTALLQVLNHFLLTRPAEGAGAALRRYLDARLPARAADDALRIAAGYRAYMRAHDALLAVQNLRAQDAVTAAGLARLSTWREQRARLRQRLFDPALVQAWYADDDLELAQGIDELQRADGGPGAAGDASGRPLPHWADPAGAARHRRYLLDTIQRALTPFAALTRRSAFSAG